MNCQNRGVIISNFALPFCNPTCFDNLWKNVCESLNNCGYFLGNFLGVKDEWSNRKDMIFFTKDEVEKLFDDFEMIYFEEKEYDKLTAMGKMKHWHVFEVVGRKK